MFEINPEIFDKHRDRITYQISLDGNFSAMKDRVGHDFNPRKGIFESFLMFNKIVQNCKDALGYFGEEKFFTQTTITQDTCTELYESLRFIIDNIGNKNINVTFDFNGDWTDTDIALIRNSLTMIYEYKKKNNLNFRINVIDDCSLFQTDKSVICPAVKYTCAINNMG